MSEPNPQRWYASKVDWWMWPLLAVPLLGGAAGIAGVVAAGSDRGLLAPLAGPLAVAVVYVGLVFPMRYAITDTELLVQHGLITRRRPLAKIVAVTPTNNPLSSPALSLDRLHIDSGGGLFGMLLISPAQKEEFLQELQQKAGLTRHGRGLVRVASGPTA